MAYVIMLNHVPFIIAAPRINANLNTLVSKGKRFIAYEIAGRLKKSHCDEIIAKLSGAVKPGDEKRGKLHQVFEPSFGERLIYDEKMPIQKIDYIHHNPGRSRWSLVRDFVFYPHSSAAFYELNKPCRFPIVHYSEVYMENGIKKEQSNDLNRCVRRSPAKSMGGDTA